MKRLAAILKHRKKVTAILAVSTAFSLLMNSIAFAMLPEQRKALESGARYVNVAELCDPSGGTSTRGNSIFFIGDSLMVGMQNAGLQEKFEANGWSVQGIQATGGHTITNAIADLDASTEGIASSNTVVVGLGTNRESNTGDKVAEMINKIREVAMAQPVIYWINAYSPTQDYSDVNASITAQSQALKFNVIDWSAEASANPGPYQFTSDGIHHSAEGYSARADFIATSLGSATSGSIGTIPENGTVALTGADNAEKIWNFLIAAGLSPIQAAGIMGNIHEESGYNPEADQGGPGGTPGAYGNAFGIVQWDGGRRVALENAAQAQGIAVTDLGFQLVYLYNESIGRRSLTAPSAANEWEGLKLETTIEGAVIYWEENFERSADTSVGLQERVAAGQAAYDQFNGTAGGIGSVAGCGALPGSGLLSPDGYSFPLEPQTRIAYSTLPCSRDTCHHDGTPAFDLSYGGVVGKKVYAIYDGVIDKIGTQDPGWCYSIQLRAADTYYYWYGHLNNLVVSEEQQVRAGDVLGEVAEWTSSHTCNGTSGGAHLHIDRGCVRGGVPQRGGGDACRDPSFVPFLNTMWEGLPES